MSSISTESLSYGVLPPVGALGAGSALAPLLPPELVSLELLEEDEDDESSDEWLEGVEAGTQSDPLSTVPSGQLPGELAPLPPPHAVTETRPTAQRAPTTTPSPPAFRSFMARMIPRLRGD